MNRFDRPSGTVRILLLILPVLVLMLALTSAAGTRGQTKTSDPPNPGASRLSFEWRSHGGDTREQRFVPLTQINDKNVADLGLVWSLDLPDERSGLAATPLFVDGVLYFSGALGAVYAVDARDGRQRWRYDPETNKDHPREARLIYANNRGVAYWNGKIYVALKDGRMVALSAQTGEPVWIRRFLIEGDKSTSSGAPRVFNGKVIIGNSGAEAGARGYVTTLDAETGALLWRFFTVPGDPAKMPEGAASDDVMAMAAKSWGGDWWKHGGGGTPWNGITFDEELNQIYIGTGNGGPWNWKMRGKKGQDNLFLTSVVALDANSGRYKWHYQYNPQEAWDWKATADIILADLEIGGRARKVLMQAPSNGFFYVIDRTDGKLISAEKFGKATWADRIDLSSGRPVEREGIRYENGPAVLYPSSYGAHSWQASSFNPATGLVYIPYMQSGMRIWQTPESAASVSQAPGRAMGRIGVFAEAYSDPDDPRDDKGSLLAWDPIRQTVRWRVDYNSFWNAGTMTTAGSLVFQGTSTGEFFAYDAATGRRLWSFNAGLGIIAPPVSYMHQGRQYVSLLVGYGAGAGQGGAQMNHGWKYGLQPRRILTFALGGRAKLPETPRATQAVEFLDDPALRLDPARIGQGAGLYYRMLCFTCHGSDAIATGGAPDLRESGIALDRQAFAGFLRSGAAASYNMPKYDDLSDTEIDDLHQYIRSEARKGEEGRLPRRNAIGN